METIMDATDQAIQDAEERGAEDGKAKASWVFDGNTDAATYKRFLAGFEDGDPMVMDQYSVSPLSGEWAGESITEILGDLLEGDDVDPDAEDDICSAYEDAFQDAYWAELQRMAMYHVKES